MAETLETKAVSSARKQSQSEFFRPKLTYPQIPWGEMLTHGATHYPENVALVFKDVNLTFREVDGLTNTFANALRDLGVKQFDRVCVLMTNRPEFVVSFYAIARLGAVASPMNPSYKEREVAYQIGNSEAVAIVVQNELLPLVEAVRHELPNLKLVITVGAGEPAATTEVHKFRDLVAKYPATPITDVKIDLEDLVALPYSSGTTGLPKGVMLTHRNLVSNHYQMVAAGRISYKDCLMLFLPFYHIYGNMLMGGAIYSGAKCVLMERFEPYECLKLVQEHKVSLFYAVPPVMVMLSNWSEINNYDLSSIRYTMCGAAPLAPEVARKWVKITGVKFLQGYGLTEASPLTHLNVVFDDTLNVLESAGLPVHDTIQKIVDIETGEKELAVGEVGEVIIHGPQVMKGYWKAAEATASTIRNGWLYTGDIGYLDEDGYLFIQDRKKEMIKYKGFGIAPAEIEALLFEHPAVADCAVIGKPDDEAGEVPKAFVVKKAGQDASTEDILAFATGRLAGYKTLREVEFVDAIPKNPSGKILRRILRDQERQKLGLS
jgi:long-chain acyl-CoA synthetase